MTARLSDRMKKKTLLVFSHLRWNFVWQRPQHLLSRLASRYDVVFVEEPLRRDEHDGHDRLDVAVVAPGITVVTPRTSLAQWGFHDAQIARIGPLLEGILPRVDRSDLLVWFYTPMALPLLDRVDAGLVVYDCMDELSAFLGAPPELVEREAKLMAVADVVLTGGPSLHEAKRHRHPNVLCLPSSVDAAHFAGGEPDGSDAAREAEALQAGIGRPRLGFFGVIDERLDIALVTRLADSHPDWQIVMVGPVVKIDPAQLPRRDNLHWLGQRSYTLLPYLLHGWDLCILPFALNASTRFISPTKTLEYMAAGKPVVSTAVRDVAWLYGEAVVSAADHDAFVGACEQLLGEKGDARRKREAAAAMLVSRSSWDGTAKSVAEAIDAAERTRVAAAA